MLTIETSVKRRMEGIKVNKSTEKKKRRNKDGRNNVDGGDIIWISKEDDETKAEGEKKRNKLRKKKKTEVGSKIMLWLGNLISFVLILKMVLMN
ncbi:hypothetical protein OIU74_027740 [Salix koriyanagi]|uniref:Transmembrane protein n=1 Tax=Salix koriyanagi TaxID=2511006 RepID=A0A9Q0VQP7_9ROSI|nr:hypothetical protein OIU74_027740 [Salix koriyanagi]